MVKWPLEVNKNLACDFQENVDFCTIANTFRSESILFCQILFLRNEGLPESDKNVYVLITLTVIYVTNVRIHMLLYDISLIL